MKHAKRLIVLIGLLAVLCIGCRSERSTFTTSQDASHTQPKAQASPDLSKIKPDSVEAPDPLESVDIPAFQKVYQAQGRPRVCIFFCKTFSPDIADWKSRISIQVSQSLNIQKASTGEALAAIIQNSNLGWGVGNESQTVITEQQTPENARAAGFLERVRRDDFARPFRQAGVQLVDESMALRKIAAQLKTADDDNAESFALVETRALEEFADVLVEVVPAIYEEELIFHAKAVDVKNAQSLGSADMFPDEQPLFQTPETDRIPGSDIQLRTDINKELQRLALRLMEDMALYWSVP